MLQSQTGKNRYARAIASQLQPCLPRTGFPVHPKRACRCQHLANSYTFPRSCSKALGLSRLANLTILVTVVGVARVNKSFANNLSEKPPLPATPRPPTTSGIEALWLGNWLPRNLALLFERGGAYYGQPFYLRPCAI